MAVPEQVPGSVVALSWCISVVAGKRAGGGPRRGRPILYSSEFVCGVSNGVTRGATGQMSTLLAEGKNVVARGEGFKVDRGRRRGLVSRDGAAKVWAGSFGIVRGKLSTLLRPKAGQDL